MRTLALLWVVGGSACIGPSEPQEVRGAGVAVEDVAREIAPMCATDGGVVCCDDHACNCYGRAQRCLDEGNRIWRDGEWIGELRTDDPVEEPDGDPAEDSPDDPEPSSFDEQAPAGDACADYDRSLFCIDGDDWCDEGDGCCESDSDARDGGPCDGPYDDFAPGDGDGSSGEPGDSGCANYDWWSYCLEDDDYCDEGDGCCDYDVDCEGF